MNAVNQDDLIQEWAQRLETELQAILPGNPTEADFRRVMDPLLEEFCQTMDASPHAHSEYTLLTGRADAVFNRFVIEYERPGVLQPNRNHRQTQHAVQQVKDYIEGLARRERHQQERLAGVAFDGKYLVFIRYLDGRWVIEDPVPVNQHSLQRFLTWLSSLSSGIGLTAENLNRDFSIEQLRTQNILRGLYRALDTALGQQNGLVMCLFEQWRLFFSEAIDYSEAFGGRKLEPLKKWVRRAGIQVHTAEHAERFFFVLHTYFALLVKLLAWLALSRHMGMKLGAPAFSTLAQTDDDTLRQHLEKMESGGIFRAFGILNLLEGDFFSWYLRAWDRDIAEAVREMLKRLDEYDPTTLTIVPEETRDLFKKLYHYLLPREIRHNLGEYYTPDWLAQRLLTQLDNTFFAGDAARDERTLRQKLLNTRFLDPACGSGTFLVLILARMQLLRRALLVNESELLDAILKNVVGFDINPLAVLTARVNYLLAIADLLEHRTREVTIPVYLADSVRTPAEGANLLTQGAYQFPTAVGMLSVPSVLCGAHRFDQFCDILDQSVTSEVDAQAFLHRVGKELNLPPQEWTQREQDTTSELYEYLLGLHRKGLNGIWARLLKNNFAPLTVGQFDYIVGNPPWINWEHLPDAYRQEIKPIWVKYGLFPHGGMDTILGKGKKDISMLMTYTVTDKLLKEGGKLGFIITQSVFKTAGAGQGFRRLKLPGDTPLKVLHVHDMVNLNPFKGASNRTAVVVLQKGAPTVYPVPYTLWRKQPRPRGARQGGFTYDSTLEEVTQATRRLNFWAEPVDPQDATSPWLTARRKALKTIRKVLGQSAYEAHAGANTGGANGVYWVEIVYRRPDGLVVVHNLTEGAKVQVKEVTEPIEPDLLYPLLRGRDVRRWCAKPSALILMVQDPRTRRGIDEKELQTRYPCTYAYLKQFEPVLRERAAFKRYFTRQTRNGIVETGPFYSMFDVGDYTFAPWKVVWPNIASQLAAAVVGQVEDKPIVPQHIVTLVACECEDEAHCICALINSSIANFGARAYSQEGGKSFGDPHILDHIRIPRFDPKNPVHQRLAALSEEAHRIACALNDISGASDAVLSEAQMVLENLPADENTQSAKQKLHEVQANRKRLREIEKEIDQLSAQVWGLSEDELQAIQQSLRELDECTHEAEDWVNDPRG